MTEIPSLCEYIVSFLTSKKITSITTRVITFLASTDGRKKHTNKMPTGTEKKCFFKQMCMSLTVIASHTFRAF